LKHLKTFLLFLAMIVFVAGTMLTGCKPFMNKVINARENELDVKEDLNLVLKDSVQRFKDESKEIIGNYEASISEFRLITAKENKENKASHEKKLGKLEQEISDLNKRLDDYKGEGQTAWTSFKNEFNHDMDEVGKELQELTLKNIK
jgi:hypothetical protein